MAIEALVWDVGNGFGEEQIARPLVATVVAAAPDVAIFPRAFDTAAQPAVLDAVQESLSADYEVSTVPYGDASDSNLLMLARRSLFVEADTITLADRSALKQTLLDPASETRVRCIGLDLDARYENVRQTQIHDLYAHTGGNHTLVGGNFHAMFRLQPTRNMYIAPKHLRLAAQYAGLANKLRLPQEVHSKELTRSERIRRLGEMASGKTMARMIDAGFFDADAHYEPTEPAIKPVMQSTHIMLKRGQFLVNQISTLHDAASIALVPEHRAIRAKITLQEPKLGGRAAFK